MFKAALKPSIARLQALKLSVIVLSFASCLLAQPIYAQDIPKSTADLIEQYGWIRLRTNDAGNSEATLALRKPISQAAFEQVIREVQDVVPITVLMVSNALHITDLSPVRYASLRKLEVKFPYSKDEEPTTGGPTDLSPLAGLQIEKLELARLPEISDLTPLASLPLERLKLDDMLGIRDLSGLQGSSVENLFLRRLKNVETLSALEGLQIRTLDLHSMPIPDFASVATLPIQTLGLYFIRELDSLEVTKNLPLSSITLRGLPKITDLSVLSDSKLGYVDLHTMENVSTLDDLTGQPIRRIRLRHSPLISSIEALSNAPLKEVDLESLPNLQDLSPLQSKNLRTLSIEDLPAVTDLSVIDETKIGYLQIASSPNIETLAPLRWNVGFISTDDWLLGATYLLDWSGRWRF